jgi:hypothetical protein
MPSDAGGSLGITGINRRCPQFERPVGNKPSIV